MAVSKFKDFKMFEEYLSIEIGRSCFNLTCREMDFVISQLTERNEYQLFKYDFYHLTLFQKVWLISLKVKIFYFQEGNFSVNDEVILDVDLYILTGHSAVVIKFRWSYDLEMDDNEDNLDEFSENYMYDNIKNWGFDGALMSIDSRRTSPLNLKVCLLPMISYDLPILKDIIGLVSKYDSFQNRFRFQQSSFENIFITFDGKDEFKSAFYSWTEEYHVIIWCSSMFSCELKGCFCVIAGISGFTGMVFTFNTESCKIWELDSFLQNIKSKNMITLIGTFMGGCVPRPFTRIAVVPSFKICKGLCFYQGCLSSKGDLSVDVRC